MDYYCEECAREANAYGMDPKRVHQLRCVIDAAHFLDCHAHIYNQANDDIPFRLYDWQRAVLADVTTHKKNVYVKTRGIGLSWLIAGYIFWCAGIAGKRVVVGSRTEEMAIDLMDRAMYIRNSVREMWPTPVRDESKRKVVFLAGGVMLSETASENMGSGYHPSVFILDEWAKLPDDAKVTASVMPAVGDDGQFIGFSSPLGLGNQFQLYYDGARRKENGFNWRKLHWWTLGKHDARWRAIYNKAWYDRQCKNLNNDPAMIAQELDCDFVQSGSPVFSKTDLDIIFNCVTGRFKHRPAPIGELEQVIVSIDPSSGETKGVADQTSIDVINPDGNQAWHEAWRLPPPEARHKIYELLARFHRPVVVIERNGLGALYANFLKGGNWTIVEVSITKGGGMRESPPDTGQIRAELDTVQKYWWDISKAALIYPLQNDIASRAMKAYHEGSYRQLLVFARTGPDQFAAPSGAHDDEVISLALGRWAWRKGLIRAVRREEVERAERSGLFPGAEHVALFDLDRGD